MGGQARLYRLDVAGELRRSDLQGRGMTRLTACAPAAVCGASRSEARAPGMGAELEVKVLLGP